MNAHFKIANPSAVDMSLSLRADVAEWRRLKEALGAGAESIELRATPLSLPQGTVGRALVESLRVFERQIGDMIRRAEASLASESWTTGFATGEVDPERPSE